MSGWFVAAAALFACSGPDPAGDKDPTSTDTGTGPTTDWECVVAEEEPPYATQLGCWDDFVKVAAQPYDSSIPGALSVKTVVDRLDGESLYFQNSEQYPIHWDFASAHLSGGGLPYVPELAQFNGTEYYSPDRRFILGAVSFYEGPGVYAYEISPYDTASAEMVTTAYRKIKENAYFGRELYFHPTSTTIETQVVPALPDDVLVITTDELFEGVEYQPYNLGTTTGLLRFRTAAEVDGQYTPFRELVVLDEVPNDISITAGIITGVFQTPLAHINVLSINRGTPNMAVKDAQNHPDLVALQDKWVELVVGPFDWTIREITQEEADAWWEANKPEPLEVPEPDLAYAELLPVEEVVVDGEPLPDELAAGIVRFGAKGTNYAALYDVGAAVPVQNAYLIPFHWYQAHMEANGLHAQVVTMLEDPQWSDPAFRSAELEALKVQIVEAPLDPAFLQLVFDQGNALFDNSDPEVGWRFRSSTNAEDLGTFTGAGLYASHTGDPEFGRDTDAEDTVAWAIKSTWASLWNPRAYEEREYYSIDHLKIAMGLLATPNFPAEEANGVAITNNIFDTSGLEPAFYVNVQRDDYSVVLPELGFVPDAYLHFFNLPGSPVVYISHSNLIPDGETILTPVQINELGVALDAIHNFFRPAFGNEPGVWYGMDVEFKFDDKDTPGDPQLYIKQARPFPWNAGTSGAAR
jgi:hypothetical protein